MEPYNLEFLMYLRYCFVYGVWRSLNLLGRRILSLFSSTLSIEHDVFRLYISVDDEVGMKIL